MKIKKLIIPALLIGLILTPTLFAQPQQQQKQQQEKQQIIIPDKIKSILKEGVQTREVQTEIPFNLVKHYYLPARQNNLHNIFIFKVKNSDLGYTPVSPPAEEEEKKEQEQAQTTQQPTGKLQANSHVFIQFNKLQGNQVGELVKEVYIPVNIQVESEAYTPDKKAIYSTGYPLPPGDYLLSMAIASQNLEKVGTQYFEFSTPDPASFTDKLGTTPIFFVKNIERMSSPETKAMVHKGCFTYSVLKITPNLDNTFKPGDYLDIFFFVFGTRPDSSGKFGINIQFKVFKEDKLFIKYADQTYEKGPIISQPLPMKRTVLIQKKKGEKVISEKKEKRDLEPGTYTLKIDINDSITKKSLTKDVKFKVVGEKKEQPEEEKKEEKEEKEKEK